jgi:hypothetical protein
MKTGMKVTPWLRRATAVALLGLVLAAGAASAEPPGHPGLLKKMLAAIESNDYDTFVAGGDPAFKAALTKSLFEEGTTKILPRLGAGYTLNYLGALNQGGFTVHLWKLSFKDGKDDLLVKMAMKDGKIGGFAFQ